ncbi:c5bfc1df-b297-4939-a075-8af5a7941a75 [Sclerotinia trifoliorum]|uniref:C5bfc1df-b297-4939-a075-8af5a7941a75 n=1 Tax=Sclerotinia trifoliorum TaxID=28548 RepID=A0A8H2ZSI1_9HELO|nr:c5bfc1df-b297-4939-a075-8af5a7941a75 [Sclerotinia trifoliorum]
MVSEASGAISPLTKSNTGFADHEDIYPIIHSAPITPIQETLLNSPFDSKFGDVDGYQGDSEESLDPELIQTNMVHPLDVPNFDSSFLMEVDPTPVPDSNFPISGSHSNPSDNHYDPTTELSEHLSLPKHSNHFPVDNGGAPSSDRVTTRCGSTSFHKPHKHANFVDPMHAQAHLKHVAVFCCQIPDCVKEPKSNFKYAIRQFILHYSRPTIAEPLYGGPRANVLPQSENPDFRIPMLLLSGGRVYRAEKLGDDPVVRIFVGDINRKKYWEILPGGIVEQLGWIGELRDTVAGAERTSIWKCKTHGHVWSVRVLDHIFDDGTGNSGSPPTSTTDYDSGYASSSGQVGASPRKRRSTYGDNNATLNMHSYPPSNFAVRHDRNEKIPIRTRHHGQAVTVRDHKSGAKNLSGNHDSLGQIEELGFEDFEMAGDITELLTDSDFTSGGEFLPAHGSMWDDELLDEVNLFNSDELSSEHLIEHDFYAI